MQFDKITQIILSLEADMVEFLKQADKCCPLREKQQASGYCAAAQALYSVVKALKKVKE